MPLSFSMCMSELCHFQCILYSTVIFHLGPDKYLSCNCIVCQMCRYLVRVGVGHADHYPQPLGSVPCYTQVWDTSSGLIPISSLGSLYFTECAIFMSSAPTHCFIHSKIYKYLYFVFTLSTTFLIVWCFKLFLTL